MNKKIIILGFIALFLLIIFFSLLKENYDLKRLGAQSGQVMDKKMKKEVIKERERVKKNLKEKYNADMVSFEAMHKRSELLKEKIRELQEEVESQKETIEKLKKKTKSKRRR